MEAYLRGMTQLGGLISCYRPAVAGGLLPRQEERSTDEDRCHRRVPA